MGFHIYHIGSLGWEAINKTFRNFSKKNNNYKIGKQENPPPNSPSTHPLLYFKHKPKLSSQDKEIIK